MHEKIPPSPPSLSLGPSVEDELIGKWFPRIGALAVVVGSGFGFKYAIDQGWIGPRLRVMVGFLVATILIGIGDWTRKRDWSAYAQAITGGGVGLLYLTLWASVDMYRLIPPSVAFVCLMGVSGLGCALALRHESQALALLSVIGGFVNPFVTGAGTEMPEGLYLYILAVDLTVVFLSFVRPWRLLEKVAFVASWIVFEIGDGSTLVTVAAATGIFVMFGAIPYVRVLMDRRRGAADLGFVPANGLIYYFAVFLRLEGPLDAWRGPLTIALALFFLVGFLVVRDRDDEASVGPASAAMSFLFVTLWAPVELGIELVPLGWALQALLFFGVSLQVKDDRLRIGAWAVLAMAIAMQLMFVAFGPVHAVNDHYGRFVFAALVTAFALAYRRERQDESDAAAVAMISANVVALLWISLEVYSAVTDGGAIVARSQDLQFGLSGAWALYAAGLLVAGIGCRSYGARMMSLALFGLTLSKMGVHDLWLLDTLQRLIGFVGMGILLLGCSLMYHRFKTFLLPDPATKGRLGW